MPKVRIFAVGEPLRREGGAGGGGEVLEGARDEAGGDLLGADFEEEVLVVRHGAPPGLAGLMTQALCPPF